MSLIKTDAIQTLAGKPILNATGSVLQVVPIKYNTQQSTSSTAYQNTNMTGSITPSSSSSKILVMFSGVAYADVAAAHAVITIFRGNNTGTILDLGGASGMGFGAAYAGGSAVKNNVVAFVVDSPSTTSSVTYTVAIKRSAGSGTVYLNVNSGTSTMTLMEIAS
jgi:hypothetical protein